MSIIALVSFLFVMFSVLDLIFVSLPPLTLVLLLSSWFYFTLFFYFLHASLFFYFFSGFPFFIHLPRRFLVQVQCGLSFSVLVLPFSLSSYPLLLSASSSIFISFSLPNFHCSTLPLSFELTDFLLVLLSNSSNNCLVSSLLPTSFFIRKCI